MSDYEFTTWEQRFRRLIPVFVALSSLFFVAAVAIRYTTLLDVPEIGRKVIFLTSILMALMALLIDEFVFKPVETR